MVLTLQHLQILLHSLLKKHRLLQDSPHALENWLAPFLQYLGLRNMAIRKDIYLLKSLLFLKIIKNQYNLILTFAPIIHSIRDGMKTDRMVS